jgi:hypothetical protein
VTRVQGGDALFRKDEARGLLNRSYLWSVFVTKGFNFVPHSFLENLTRLSRAYEQPTHSPGY